MTTNWAAIMGQQRGNAAAFFSERELDILRRGCEGVCVRGQWKWIFDGEPAGRAVRKLERLGLLHGHYMSGGRAAMNATDRGREIVGRG